MACHGGLKTKFRPAIICHSDWGSSPKKRWRAVATLDGDGRYTAHTPQRVNKIGTLLAELRAEAGSNGRVFAGFDFPIGIPGHYARCAKVSNFITFLEQLGEGNWSEFFSVCDSPAQISVYRPFYPNQSDAGVLRQHLFDGHGVTSMEPLLRRCERGGNGQKQACSLFWTLGGNQVGKAALCGWKDVLIPALRGDDSVGLWPFDGTLESLFERKGTIIAETYPAECYGWFPGKPLRSKADIGFRREFGSSLLSWAAANEVAIEWRLEDEIRSGFTVGKDDAFDAVVGLFGMLKVTDGDRASGEPNDASVKQVEGWILGRKASTVDIEQTESPRWSEWRLFPDPRRCEILVVPFGPGCYDLRNRRTNELILCGTGDHLAERMSSLLPKPHGCGTRNNAAKREYVLAHLGHVEYRTIATATKAEALDLERQLLRNRRYLFPT